MVRSIFDPPTLGRPHLFQNCLILDNDFSGPMVFEARMKRESEYRDQFIQYVVTQVPLTGLWVTKGQILVKEDEILKVFLLTNSTDNEFNTEDEAEIYILNAAKKAIDTLLERQPIQRFENLMKDSAINIAVTKKMIQRSRKLIEESRVVLNKAQRAENVLAMLQTFCR
jgi:hypothetical protein